MSNEPKNVYLPPYRDLRAITEQRKIMRNTPTRRPKDYDESGYTKVPSRWLLNAELFAGGLVCGFVLFWFAERLTS